MSTYNHVGYACIHMNLDVRTSRTMRVANFEEEKWKLMIHENLVDLNEILRYNINHGIKMFRISSDIIPLSTHPVQNLPWHEIHKDLLNEIGELIINNDLRVSMHPGQYTVLNSPHEEVALRAVADIEYHTLFLDALGINQQHKIILHVGGIYADKEASIKRWLLGYDLLSENAKGRLVLENDDKHYTFEDVYAISKVCGIPIVFDYFHHQCNHAGDHDLQDIMNRVKSTWTEKDGPLKLHYSEQDPTKRKGAHAPSIQMVPFLHFYNQVASFNPYIMIEAKNKNIAAIKAKNCIKIIQGQARPSDTIYEWSRYKYVIMAYGYEHYKRIQKMMRDNCTLSELYTSIDEIMLLESPDTAKLNTLSHIWGYLKDVALPKEKIHYLKLLANTTTYPQAKIYLHKLCQKYNITYLLESYYFHF